MQTGDDSQAPQATYVQAEAAYKRQPKRYGRLRPSKRGGLLPPLNTNTPGRTYTIAYRAYLRQSNSSGPLGLERTSSHTRDMQQSDNRKKSIYMPAAMLQELIGESERLDRSISWLLQYAYRSARAEIAQMPTVSAAFETPAPAPNP